jgi:GH24 family phage-related lysozyme (muramidase)
MNKNKYTQRQWDRTVGWGKVTKEYSILESEVDEQEDRSAVEDADD